MIKYNISKMINQQSQEHQRLNWTSFIEKVKEKFHQRGYRFQDLGYMIKLADDKDNLSTVATIQFRNQGNFLILVDVVGIGKNNSNITHLNPLQIARKENLQVKNCKIRWVSEQNNFAANTCIYITQQTEENPKQITKNLIKCINYLRNTVKKCSQKKANLCKQTFDYIRKILYICDIERTKRNNHTKLDFNNYKIKTWEQYNSLYELYESGQFRMKMKANWFENNINIEQAKKVYQKYVKQNTQNNQEQQEQLKQQKYETILSSIHFSKQKQCSDELSSRFGHMKVCQCRFNLIFSVNNQTNKYMMEEGFDSTRRNNKQQFMKLVQKSKCKEFCEICQKSKIKNQEEQIQKEAAFQNEINILLWMKQKYNQSICKYFIQNYDKLGEIYRIYSTKHPIQSTKFLQKQTKRIQKHHHLQKMIKYFEQIAEGVDFLVKNFIIHRDLKPGNIMMDEKNHVKIIDFGSATKFNQRAKSEKEKKQEELRYTDGYHFNYKDLPNKLKNQITEESYNKNQFFDVYSLGKIIENNIINFKGNKNQTLWNIKDTLNYLIKKCTTIQPADRLAPLQIKIILQLLKRIVIVSQQME